jgi:hypothetical protein
MYLRITINPERYKLANTVGLNSFAKPKTLIAPITDVLIVLIGLN